MSDPAVSVLLPVYNARPYLMQAVESVLGQTFRDLEVVTIDDGSSDGGIEDLRAFADRDPRFRLLTRPNKGLIATLNEGLALCRGRYVARMDADDVALPDRLARQVTFLNSNPHIAGVGGAMILMTAAGRPLRKVNYPCGPEEIRNLLPRQNCLPHPAITLRREALVAAGGYRPTCLDAEDYDLWLRLAESWGLANLPEVVLHYRVHGGQVSQRHLRQQVLTKIAVQAAARLRARGLSDECLLGTVPSEESLRRAGLTSCELDRAFGDALVSWLQLYLDAGPTDFLDRMFTEVVEGVTQRAPAAERRDVRRRLLNRLSDMLIWTGAERLQAGLGRIARSNLLAALRLNPLRAFRPWTLSLLARSLFTNSVIGRQNLPHTTANGIEPVEARS